GRDSTTDLLDYPDSSRLSQERLALHERPRRDVLRRRDSRSTDTGALEVYHVERHLRGCCTGRPEILQVDNAVNHDLFQTTTPRFKKRTGALCFSDRLVTAEQLLAVTPAPDLCELPHSPVSIGSLRAGEGLPRPNVRRGQGRCPACHGLRRTPRSAGRPHAIHESPRSTVPSRQVEVRARGVRPREAAPPQSPGDTARVLRQTGPWRRAL